MREHPRVRGSLTIEAALYMPLLLFILFISMRLGIYQYQTTAELANQIKMESQMDVLKIFYGAERIKDLFEE